MNLSTILKVVLMIVAIHIKFFIKSLIYTFMMIFISDCFWMQYGMILLCITHFKMIFCDNSCKMLENIFDNIS